MKRLLTPANNWNQAHKLVLLAVGKCLCTAEMALPLTKRAIGLNQHGPCGEILRGLFCVSSLARPDTDLRLHDLDEKRIMRKGVNMMRTFGRAAWVGQAWLTAFMTLVAGLPHLSCLCPDGRVKSVCLSVASESSGCCCGGTCCTPTSQGSTCCCKHKRGSPPKATASDGAVRTCCQAQDERGPESSTKTEQVRSPGCTKTPATTGVTTISQKKTRGNDNSVVQVLCLSGQPNLCCTAQSLSSSHPTWQSHEVAPPTDLVTTLQRFLI
jgi:hypothetical protein